MKEQPPSEPSELLLALQELRAMGVVSESEYAAETSIDTSHAAEKPPESPAARMRLSLLRRFLHRE
jgi:hypothetical protein